MPTTLTVLLLLSALFAVAPIRDAVTLQPTPAAQLRLSLGYVLMAPLSDMLDTLTLLAVPQHIALGVWCIIFYALARAHARGRSTAPAWTTELIGAAGLVGVLVVVYAAVAFLPRPMAQLDVLQSDVVAVDFHVHTNYSHDGRAGFTPERVRAWEHAAGYDAAYISDHATYEGAAIALQGNPSSAADGGTILMQALEAIYNGEHVNILNAGHRYRNLTTSDLRNVDPQALALMSTIGNVEPVIIETLPGDLSKMLPAAGAKTAGVRAIELIDGSPRGLTQTRRDHARIVKLSDSLHLARVTGSDNHGYGRAAPGWTLVRARDWRVLSADSLSKVIELTIRAGGPNATGVIERRIAGGTNLLTVVLAPILVPWRMLTTLSVGERVAWLAWMWAVTLAVRWWRRRPVDAGL